MEIIEIDDIGYVRIKKTKTKRLKITFGKVGEVELRIPKLYPKKLAIEYLKKNKEWINKHRPHDNVIRQGEFVLDYKIIHHTSELEKVRVSNKNKTIRVNSLDFYHPTTQLKIHKTASKVLREKAKQLIPQMVAEVAEEYNLSYSTVDISSATSRWGSCSQTNRLMFSSYLIQLSSALITYVIKHELAHTIEHNHSKKYWNIVEGLDPDYKVHRTHLKTYRPSIITSSTANAVR